MTVLTCHCRECGEMMEIGGDSEGVSHHVNADGGIDYDADADHGAVADVTDDEPSPEALEMFDDSANDATHLVLDCFEWMGLPDEGSDQRTELLYRLNDAITAIMRDWL